MNDPRHTIGPAPRPDISQLGEGTGGPSSIPNRDDRATQVPWSASAAADTPVPAFIGDYAVIKKIGEGGMGSVYLAEDTKLRRKVALKTMRPALAADRSNRSRFLREAQAAAAVEHENIVPIWSVVSVIP